MDEGNLTQRAASRPGNPAGFRWSEHRAAQAGLIITIVPIALAALRLYVVSGGDDVVLKSLASTLSIQALILGTYLVTLPIIFMAASWMAVEWLGRSDERHPLAIKAWAMLTILSVSALLLPVGFAIIGIVPMIARLIRAHGSRTRVAGVQAASARREPRKKRRTPRRPGLARRVYLAVSAGPVVAFWAVALIFIFGAGMWLPSQAVLLKGRSYPAVAYVLNQADGQTTLLFKDPAVVRTVATADIEARVACVAASSPPSWLIKPTYVYVLPTSLNIPDPLECDEIIDHWPSNPAAPVPD
ncbi:hypothetical protein [Micromonospora sp. DT227]|uniref:hypothetical protein n=1 Tax=Micromonospora sp. DT227 TaxID=3393433 RepID=UPI003CF220CB